MVLSVELILRAMSDGLCDRIQDIIDWTVDFFEDSDINLWIKDNFGWVSYCCVMVIKTFKVIFERL